MFILISRVSRIDSQYNAARWIAMNLFKFWTGFKADMWIPSFFQEENHLQQQMVVKSSFENRDLPVYKKKIKKNTDY